MKDKNLHTTIPIMAGNSDRLCCGFRIGLLLYLMCSGIGLIGCLQPIEQPCTGQVDPLTGACILAVCGNDICEDLSGENTTTCPQDCSATAVCNSDGICDAARGETTANCPADCPTVEACNNNGTCDAGETETTCPGDCPSQPTCNNDGTCDAGETEAGCPADCPSEPVCNDNGTCDTGETEANCPGDCAIAPADCGNGELDGNETCDDGNTEDDDGCDAFCRVDQCYQCNGAEPTVCVLDCSLGADCCPDVCGNGFVDDGESCDDGNASDGDGCSASCEVEQCYECDNADPSVCGLNCSLGNDCCLDSVCNGDPMGQAEIQSEWNALEVAIYTYINELRADGYTCPDNRVFQTQDPITPSRQLHAAARVRSGEVASTGSFNETVAEAEERLQDADYPAGLSCSWGSLVAASTNPTAEGMVNSLITNADSPASCHRVFDEWLAIGVGLAVDPNVTNRAIITIDFGR